VEELALPDAGPFEQAERATTKTIAHTRYIRRHIAATLMLFMVLFSLCWRHFGALYSWLTDTKIFSFFDRYSRVRQNRVYANFWPKI